LLTTSLKRYSIVQVSASGLPVFLFRILYTLFLIQSLESICSLLSSGILYSRLQRVMIPDAVIIQFVLLKMGMLMFGTCRGL